MNENKFNGKKTDFAYLSEDASRVVIGYGYQPVDEESGTWQEVVKYKKQTSQLSLSDVKDAIIADIDRRTRERIIGGLTVDGQPVWLSEENQINFSTAQAPATFKIGQQEDGTPVYREFKTAKELTAFWQTCAVWKQECLAAGWAEKDAIDFTPYEACFGGGGDEPENA